jgi:uncharacterized protein YndB with AHSA1/START domain
VVGTQRLYHHRSADGCAARWPLAHGHARPDGRDYNNRLVFLEVVESERLVYKTDREKDSEPVDFQVTVTFTARGDKTEVTLYLVFPSVAECERVVTQYRAIEGAEQNLARLAEHLARI